MKNLLMIGGGYQQVRAVEIARNNGYTVIVVDRNKNCPCSKSANEVYQIDGRDVESLVSLGIWLKSRSSLDGVFTFTELVTSVAAVAEACGLVGAGLSAAVKCQDKGLSKDIWMKNGIATPKGITHYGQLNIDEILSEVKCPLIVKPVTGSGGFGMLSFVAEEHFREWWSDFGRKINYQSRVVIEELVVGSSHDVNGLFDEDGKFYPYGIVDRDFVPGTYIENSILAPSLLNEDDQAKLYILLEESARALGLNYGPVKGDGVLVDGEFKMLEVAPRLHGPKFSLYAMPAVCEDYLSGFFQLISGQNQSKNFTFNYNGDFFKSHVIRVNPGKIYSIGDFSTLSHSSREKYEILQFKTVNDVIVEAKSSHDAFGYVLATGKSRSDVNETVNNVLSSADVRTVPFSDGVSSK